MAAAIREHDKIVSLLASKHGVSFDTAAAIFSSGVEAGRLDGYRPAAVAAGFPVETVDETTTPTTTSLLTTTESKAKRRKREKLPTAKYTELRLSTPEDWVVQGAAFDKYAADGNILRNVLDLVEKMKGERGEVGAIVDMYEHSLQTATRARRGGADTETIVCALLHDVGEVLSGTNHGEIPAALLRPYISPMNHWVLSQHEVFQAYFFLDKCGGDKDLRDKVQEYTMKGLVKGHAYYEACAKFCLEYDQTSFDPAYDTDSMESFVPLVAEVLGRTPFWWEPEGKAEEELDPKARLAFGYSLSMREEKAT